MKIDDIRRLYRSVDPAIAEEAVRTTAESLTDPDAARKLLDIVYSLSVEDRSFAVLLRLFLEGMLMRLIRASAEEDDRYALDCSKLIIELMEGMAPPARAGSGREAKSA